MNIAEIETAIAALSPEEFDVLQQWIAGFVGESRHKVAAAGRGRLGRRRGRACEELQVREPPPKPGSRHSRTDHFRICCRQLPGAIRVRVDECFELLNRDPAAPALQFQKDGLIWSMNVGKNHKALALDANGRLLWYWVGSCEACYAPTK
jgi:hypothetical protein